MMNDRTFERIDSLFDITLFADVKVLVAGCGSGGASVALQLVMCGIRNFTLIDNDILGPENVIRHVCGRRYVGQKKVDAVAEVLLDRNPKTSIAKIDADIMNYDGLAPEIAKTDVVVLATDNEPSRYTINEICVRNRIPFVVGRVFTRGIGGEVFAYRSGRVSGRLIWFPRRTVRRSTAWRSLRSRIRPVSPSISPSSLRSTPALSSMPSRGAWPSGRNFSPQSTKTTSSGATGLCIPSTSIFTCSARR
jgi:hypothetical protein